MKRSYLKSAFAAAGLAALAVPALSWTSFGTWLSINVTLSASAVSFPVANSFRTALGTVESRFFNEQGSDFWFTMVYDDPAVGMNNGQSEVWFSSDAGFSPAVTFWWTIGSVILETDAIFYNGLAWTTSYSKTNSTGYGGPNRPFETTVTHEFGHCAGLGHEADEYNIMGQDWNHITCNGSSYRSYVGEDAADGLVDNYGLYSGGTIEDLGVTLFRYSGSSGEYSTHDMCEMFDAGDVVLGSNAFDGQRRYEVDNGQVVRVQFNFENNGETTQSNVALRYYVSTNSIISTFDTEIGSASITIARNDVFTYVRTLTIPTNLNEDQTYYLGVLVDDPNVIAEATEVNNAAYHIFQVSCEATPFTNFFNSGTNPASLSAGVFTLNDPYNFTVDVFTSGHSLASVFGFESPVTVVLGGGQTLLTLDFNGEVLQLGSQSGPVANFPGVVPNRADLCGYTFTAQAIHFGGAPSFVLSNAQDIRVGN